MESKRVRENELESKRERVGESENGESGRKSGIVRESDIVKERTYCLLKFREMM